MDAERLKIDAGEKTHPNNAYCVARCETGRLRTALVILSLVLQNSGLVLVTKHTHRTGAAPYATGSVIFMAELIKLVACICMELTRKNRSGSLLDTFKINHSNVFMLIPASLYVIQNNLTFFAIKGLSPTIFIVCSQMKILSSAFFSVVLLKGSMTSQQKFAVFLLTVGVAVVQVGQQRVNMTYVHARNSSVAFLALSVSVIISGLAGAILEKAFKSEGGSSIWVRNFFLSLFSVPTALFAAFRDVQVENNEGLTGFFNGYDASVIFVVALQALGGLLTASVMKYAGVVAKCFAVSLSTVICTITGIHMGHEDSLETLLCGSAIINIAVYMYFVQQRD